MQTLTQGQNTNLPTEKIQVIVTTGKASDISSFRVYADGKTKVDDDFIFYGQVKNLDNTITCDIKNNETLTTFELDLPRIKSEATKITFGATSNFPKLSELGFIKIEVKQGFMTLVQCEVNLNNRSELALILGEVYRHNGAWKFRFISQGFDGGLKPLAEFYGVTIADDSNTPPPQASTPPPQPSTSSLNLSKITLTKESPRLNLNKSDIKDGIIKINLDWNSNSSNNSFWGNSKIDLDLVAFIKMKDGFKDAIQALGGRFGSLEHEPYVKLLEDDRTGATVGGEWLHVSDKNLHHIEEILIIASIYEGVPNWQATNGVVKIYIPGQQEIETRLTEGSNNLYNCAIARILNKNNTGIQIERIDRYFRTIPQISDAFSWGFRWTEGSKD